MKLRLRHVAILTGVLFVLAYASWQLSNALSYQVFGRAISRIECARPVVALTFDDGPSSGVLPLLEVLRAADVKATFFAVGQALAKAPQLGSRIVAEGHELGNHTYTHRRMVFKSWSFIDSELSRTDDLIRSAGQRGQIQFRPPYGKKLLLLPYYLSRQQRASIMWDVAPDGDPELAGNADRIAAYVLSHVQPGSIVLLHPMFASGQASRDAVGPIITGLRQRGYSFATVSGLAAACSA